jgi:hypothetical protein
VLILVSKSPLRPCLDTLSLYKNWFLAIFSKN